MTTNTKDAVAIAAKSNANEAAVMRYAERYMGQEGLKLHRRVAGKANRTQLLDAIGYERACKHTALAAYEKVANRRDELNDAYGVLSGSINKLQVAHDKLVEDNTALTDTVADLKAVASDRAQRLEAQAHSISAKDTEIAKLQVKVRNTEAQLTERNRFADNLAKTNAELRNELRAIRDSYNVRCNQHTDDMHRWQKEHTDLKNAAFAWTLGNFVAGAVVGGAVIAVVIRVFGWA